MADAASLTDTQRTPPKGVAAQAQRGLTLRDKHGCGDPSAGRIAWLLWGGDPGVRWINRLHDRLLKAPN